MTSTTPHDATELGIATVYQDLALAENLDVVAEPVPRPGARRHACPGSSVLDETAMEQKAVELLSSLGVTTLRSVRTEVASLSGGQRQAVAIARSLLGEPKIVLLDEPTAALGIVQTAQILKLIERLRERGLGVIVISHNLADVFEVADRDRRPAAGAEVGRLRGRRSRPARRSSPRSPAPTSPSGRPRRRHYEREPERVRRSGTIGTAPAPRQARPRASRSGGRCGHSPAATSPRSGC